LPQNKPQTLGELKASGYKPRGVKDELRANLRCAIERRQNPFAGIHGYERTVLPALYNAVLSRHDLLLLGCAARRRRACSGCSSLCSTPRSRRSRAAS
jgi:magnesium chelatase subunit I